MRELIDSLRSLQASHADIDAGLFALAVLASLAASLLAGALYHYFYESRGTGSQVHRAFPLLGISITSLFVSIQISLPLSLGLLGALSIIRFRTPIKEPEEVGFIMLVIASSISCATFNFEFLVILLAVACALLLVLRRGRLWRRFGADGLIVLTADDPAAAARLSEVTAFIAGATRSSALESATRHGTTASFQFTFSGLKGDPAALQEELSRRGPFPSVDVFFNRPGGIR